MASNKELLVIILDIRQDATAQLKKKSVECVTEVLKDKIAGGKKDFVSFVLLGAQRTSNTLNNDVSNEDYCNIVQYPNVGVASWTLVTDFLKFVNEPSCSDGHWLDALVVAMDIMNSLPDVQKFQRHRILFFHDFDSQADNFEVFGVVTDNIARMETELLVVSNNIRYIDNDATGEAQAIFRHSPTKSDSQLENEKHALRLVTNCNAKLLNFHEAFKEITRTKNKRPWAWNKTLFIGTGIAIKIAAIISISDDTQVALKKCWGEPDEVVTQKVKSYVRNIEVDVDPADIIDGYMLGSTPIAFDESVRDGKEQNEPGLKFIGFIKRDAIPEELYCGNALYLVVHQRGMQASAKMLNALVKAATAMQMSILCWKIYSYVHNNPKIVLLIPNQITDDRPASLSMVELAYHVQQHYWDFPKLQTKKTACTQLQLDAIDNLIDSMDLMLNAKDGKQPRMSAQKDLLPFDSFTNIYDKCLLDMLERKVLSAKSDDDAYFKDMASGMDFKEVFWKLPEAIEEKAKSASKKVKELFPVEKSSIPMAKLKAAMKAKSQRPAMKNSQESMTKDFMRSDGKRVDHIGSTSPAEDFEILLKEQVLAEEDNTRRDIKFNAYAEQLRAVLWEALFSSSPKGYATVAAGLRTLRRRCYDFNAFPDYNNWMQRVRAEVSQRQLYDFWNDYIVKEQLGLCAVGEPSLEEKINAEKFYNIVDEKENL